MGSNEILKLRREGKRAEALAMARATCSSGGEDIWLLRAYGWTIYDHAKTLIEDHEENRLSPTALNSRLSPFMHEFSRIADGLRGDSVFSQMLRLAGKASSQWREFLPFARWAGVDDFHPDDKKPFTTPEGKRADSLQVRFIRAVCRETAAAVGSADADVELIAWGKEITAQSLRDRPDDQWLNYYQAKIYLSEGSNQKAMRHLLPVIRRQIRAAWPWSLLAEILEPQSVEDAIVCLTHAVELAREEQEVARVRIRLAQRLCEKERYAEAALQARQAASYREQHGYKLPTDLIGLLQSDWYAHVAATGSFRPSVSARNAALALLDRLDGRTVTLELGVIDHINQDKALSYVATGAETGVPILHSRFPESARWAAGTVVEVGRADGTGPPTTCRVVQTQRLPGLLETFAGRYQRVEGSDYAFVRSDAVDIFIPPALAGTVDPDGPEPVSCLAIRRANKQGKIGWRAVRIHDRFVPQTRIPHSG